MATVEQAWLDELSELLRIPSISADPLHGSDVLAAAAQDGTRWLRGPHWKPSPYPTTWVKEHRVEVGEDLPSMAGKYLGDTTRAREVADLNGLVSKDALC